METDKQSEVDLQGFQFDNAGLSRRCNDVFANLDALEKKHKAFEVSRAKDDADLDKRLINQSHEQKDNESSSSSQEFKCPALNTGRDYKSSKKGGRHGQERDRGEQSNQPFRKPMPLPRGRGRCRYGRGRNSPDYKVHPEKWTSYSLEDVDVSDSSNKQAAFEFLNERRRVREGEAKEDGVNVDSTACSSGQFTFNKPTKSSAKNTSSFKSKQELSTDKTSSQKSTGSWETDNYEKMDDSDASSNTKSANSRQVLVLETEGESQKGAAGKPGHSDIAEFSGHLKRKLDINDIVNDSEMKTGAEEEEDMTLGFKSRKVNKKISRAIRRRDDEEDEED